MESLAFLDRPHSAKLQAVYVLHGDEDFLKRQCLVALRQIVFGAEGSELGLSIHSGDKTTWAAVFDELETVPLLSPRRLVLIENADAFVTRHRAALEKYVAQPASTGTLII